MQNDSSVWIFRLGGIEKLPFLSHKEGRLAQFRPIQMGTAILLNGYRQNGLCAFLTAFHVVNDATRSKLKLFVFPPASNSTRSNIDKLGWHVNGYRFDQKRDVAILFVNVSVSFRRSDGFRIGNWQETQIGSVVSVRGYPVNQTVLGFTSGPVRGTNFFVIAVQARVEAGFSGGPVTLSSAPNRLIGVVLRSTPPDAPTPAFHAASLDSGIVENLCGLEFHRQLDAIDWLSRDEL